ncbi:hypothetical protein PAMP_022297 [Pampus punctatissimus]
MKPALFSVLCEIKEKTGVYVSVNETDETEEESSETGGLERYGREKERECGSFRLINAPIHCLKQWIREGLHTVRANVGILLHMFDLPSANR